MGQNARWQLPRSASSGQMMTVALGLCGRDNSARRNWTLRLASAFVRVTLLICSHYLQREVGEDPDYRLKDLYSQTLIILRAVETFAECMDVA